MSISMHSMLEAGVHFGHQTKYWNPKMKPFIFGSRNKIHIINLDKTLPLFEEALKFVNMTIKNKGNILFLGTRSQASEIIKQHAMRCGMPYVNHRWLGGMLTNFETVKKSIKKLETKKAAFEKATETGLSKKESLDLSREIDKLEYSIGGIAEMKSLPSAIFIIDTGVHDIAIKEAKRLGITIIGVVDTNNDPSEVDYIIPGNDDSSNAIEFYASLVADTIISAKEASEADLVASVRGVEMVEQEAKPKTVRRVNKVSDSQTSDNQVQETAKEDTVIENSDGIEPTTNG